MTNKKITSKTTIAMFAIIPALLVLAVGVESPLAFASHCEGAANCYATNHYTDSTKGLKYDAKISNMGPASPPTSEELTITGWVIFSDGTFVENGFASGDVAGTDGTDERSYYGFEDIFGIHEYRSSALTVGTTYTFLMADLDGNKQWEIKRDSTSLANVYLAEATSEHLEVGMEGNKNNPATTWIPETEIRDVKDYNTSSWNAPNTYSKHENHNSKGYYHDYCASGYEDFNVGTDSGVNC